MTGRHRPLPRVWLMTDERMGERLWEAIDRLPDGEAGIVLRHYQLHPDARASLARRIAETCRRRRLTLAVARDVGIAREVGADLVHNPPQLPIDLRFSRSVHSLAQAESAKAEGASLVFISPIFHTRSHLDTQPLERALALQIAKAAGAPAIALGGMNATKGAQLQREGFYGWAGIDAWLSDDGN